ncbi:ABC transporter permease subunit, partial [Caballeronia sp. ATUFL_M2_KS44]|uniref:ABC transporter permease subunit n=1 Tax=Caballeronia sp. ATUFL_M2_KS44 TaxID=2921767 RepID=UPI002027A462
LVVPVGLLMGTVAGYCGGIVDTVLMRLTDVALAFPKIVLALAFAAAVGRGVLNGVIAVSNTAWPPYARLARAESLRLAQADYI